MLLLFALIVFVFAVGFYLLTDSADGVDVRQDDNCNKDCDKKDGKCKKKAGDDLVAKAKCEADKVVCKGKCAAAVAKYLSKRKK